MAYKFNFSLKKRFKEEYEVLKCQFGTSKVGRGGKQKLPTHPKDRRKIGFDKRD